MATSQMFVALCVVGVAVAAPQLTLGSARATTGNNENEVVSNVITALQPSIAQAVQEALAGLSFNNEASAAAEAEAAADAEAARLDRQRQQARRRQQIAAANAAAAAAALERESFESEVSNDLGPHVRPVYNFEYKVADDEAQTYISRSEERDGDELSGTYSFVDSTGALITVNYNAGLDGYEETRSSEKGFVQMRAQPPWTGPLAGVDGDGATSARGASAQSGSRGVGIGSGSGSRASSAFGSSRSGSSSSSSLSSSSSSVSQADLINRIISALQPQISSAVAAALS